MKIALYARENRNFNSCQLDATLIRKYDTMRAQVPAFRRKYFYTPIRRSFSIHTFFSI